jgi:hypothetical protein
MSDTKEEALPPNKWARKQVFKDPHPSGLINQRILGHALLVLAKETGFDKKELDGNGDGDLFMRLIVLVCRKMTSVWLHMERYRKEEEELVRQLRERPMAQPPIHEMECSDTLFLEFDEFLVQIKSTLDYLVKVPRAVIGRSWNLTRFGDKGQMVVRAMQRSTPKEFQGKVARIEKHLFQEANLKWLDFTIRARDDMNHYLQGDVSVEKFSVVRDRDGKIDVPRWAEEQALSEFMTNLWAAFFYFVEDFITLFASLRFQEGTVLYLEARDAVSVKSPWRVIPKLEAEFMRAVQEGRIRTPGVTPQS